MSTPRPHRVAGFVAVASFLVAAGGSVVLLVRSSGADPLSWIELVFALIAVGVLVGVLRRGRRSRAHDQP